MAREQLLRRIKNCLGVRAAVPREPIQTDKWLAEIGKAHDFLIDIGVVARMLCRELVLPNKYFKIANHRLRSKVLK